MASSLGGWSPLAGRRCTCQAGGGRREPVEYRPPPLPVQLLHGVDVSCFRGRPNGTNIDQTRGDCNKNRRNFRSIIVHDLFSPGTNRREPIPRSSLVGGPGRHPGQPGCGGLAACVVMPRDARSPTKQGFSEIEFFRREGVALRRSGIRVADGTETSGAAAQVDIPEHSGG